MADTKKTDRILAMRLEKGKVPTAAELWSGASAAQTLGAGNQTAYFGGSPSLKSKLASNDEIEGQGNMPLPSQVGKDVEGSLPGPVRYQGLEVFLYAAFGYERPGADGSPFSAGGGFFEHFFELDSKDRHQAPYRESLDLSGVTLADISYSTADRKNRSITLGMKMGPNDYRWPSSMIKKFSFSGDSDSGLVSWSYDVQAFDEARGSFSSGTWTFPSNHTASNNVLFHHGNISLGNVAGGVDTGIKSWNCEIEIPLNLQRDTESGLFLQEPRFAGKYDVKLSLVISRHTADTLLAARDAATTQECKIEHTLGSFEFNLYFPNLTIDN